MHKTGSSSIQQSLNGFENSDLVYFSDYKGRSNHGHTIFGLLGTKGSSRPGSEGDQGEYRENPKLLDPLALDSVDRSFRLLNGRDMLISAEGIMFLSEAELYKLSDLVHSKFDEIKVVAYVRTPAAYMTSLFQQRIKGESIEKFNIASDYCNYKRSFSKFDRVFGRENIELWKFDPKSFPDNCVVMDFCNKLGIQFPKGRAVRVNESLSREMLELLFTYRTMSKSMGLKPLGGAEKKLLIEELVGIGYTKPRISPDVVRPILDKNGDDIKWMEERLGQSLYENMDSHNSDDISDQSDLLKPNSETIAKLVEKLGDSHQKDNKGETPEEVALLVHALREKLRIQRGKLHRKEEAYLNRGKIVRADTAIVTGWAIGSSYEIPAQMTLVVNGKEVAQTVADKYRKSLVKRGVHPSGYCGFIFHLNNDECLKEGDKIEVVAVNDDVVKGLLSLVLDTDEKLKQQGNRVR